MLKSLQKKDQEDINFTGTSQAIKGQILYNFINLQVYFKCPTNGIENIFNPTFLRMQYI